MRYRLLVSYDGTDYAGWQRQDNAVTVQEVLETALEELLGVASRVVGAGRTDAGVHARGQVAHLDLDKGFSLRGLVHGTNRFLPRDVRVVAADQVDDEFHAQYSARAKEYRYYLDRSRVVHPLDARFTVAVDSRLDLEQLFEATALVVGVHDFRAFARTDGSPTSTAEKNTVREVFEAEWLEHGSRLWLRVVGEGFLRGMVRALVGTLLQVARGQRSVSCLRSLLEGAPRSEAGPNAAAHGLQLFRVDYGPPWGSLAERWDRT